MARVIIFGAGNCGRLIAEKILVHKQDKILFFVDNDSNKHGKTYWGGGKNILLEIKSPLEIRNTDFDSVILGTFTGLDELKAQLQEEFNIPTQKIDSSYIKQSVLARISFLEDFASICKEKNLQGEIAEVGVYRGDFAHHMNAFFPHKKLYLFDTFEGFNGLDVQKDGHMSKELGEKHFANTSVELVLSKMPHKEQCVIKQGWFPQSTKGLMEEKFCFVNLDADLYEPILEGLRFFYPRMVQGGVILVHEYFSQGYIGVKKAVLEFLQESNAMSLPIGDSLSIAILKR
ncbi:methyltransferase [Helicobacter monodelphidis]|uniref:TylF/MycF/NovP-related O-methyltransferase n=1 Tax=Helicobacter sp. 15-1451 TaxID=2004995 RepID=UPI000DCC2236|nr:TylF/MycF/NovP-related O-methyltransferase [Helicobacter sp. 15-1451]RAX57062.1 methyltransferase [Helicobacter sp. 15-1451]